MNHSYNNFNTFQPLQIVTAGWQHEPPCSPVYSHRLLHLCSQAGSNLWSDSLWKNFKGESSEGSHKYGDEVGRIAMHQNRFISCHFSRNGVPKDRDTLYECLDPYSIKNKEENKSLHGNMTCQKECHTWRWTTHRILINLSPSQASP